MMEILCGQLVSQVAKKPSDPQRYLLQRGEPCVSSKLYPVNECVRLSMLLESMKIFPAFSVSADNDDTQRL